MDVRPAYPALSERMTSFWERGVRIATRFAMAFGLSTLTGIGIGFAVTDNVLAQIFVTAISALALWIPFVVVISRLEAWRDARRNRRARAKLPIAHHHNRDFERDWQQLTKLAPSERSRLARIKSSIDRSRLALGKAYLDPEAHDLCILIDRRLPQLVRRELDDLPTDDAGRLRQLGKFIDLVEQFSRHCDSHGDRVSSGNAREAAILRRRFEARLADHSDGL